MRKRYIRVMEVKKPGKLSKEEKIARLYNKAKEIGVTIGGKDEDTIRDAVHKNHTV